MKIRSVTLGNNVSWPLSAGEFAKASRFFGRAQELFGEAGVEVQTTRLATQPVGGMKASPVELGGRLESACREAGIGYCSLGPAVPEPAALSDLLASTTIVFASLTTAS